LVSSSAALTAETSFQSSAVVVGRALMKVIVTCSSTMGIPSGLMFSSGLAILSRVSASSSLPPQELSTAVEASAAPETSALRRVMGRMVIVSFHRDYRMGSWRSRRVRSADGGYGEHGGRRQRSDRRLRPLCSPYPQAAIGTLA